MKEMDSKIIVKNSQSGQALVEYVLLLVITISLILGLASQIYRPFGGWLQNYMGAYLECLIDVGELPSLGYQDSSGECNARFQPGTLTTGRPPVSNSSGAGTGSRPNSGNTNNSSDSGAGGSSFNSSGGGSSRASSRGFSVGGPRGADGPASASASNVITEKLPESGYFRLRSRGGTVSNSPQNGRSRGISGVIKQEQERIQKREQRAFSSGQVSSSEINSNRAKKLIVKPPERKLAANDEDKPWSFGEYLKFGLIFLIIVAIILFLAGQLLQISKSMEK